MRAKTHTGWNNCVAALSSEGVIGSVALPTNGQLPPAAIGIRARDSEGYNTFRATTLLDAACGLQIIRQRRNHRQQVEVVESGKHPRGCVYPGPEIALHNEYVKSLVSFYPVSLRRKGFRAQL